MELLIFHADPLSSSPKTFFRFCQSSWIWFLSDLRTSIILELKASNSLFTAYIYADNMSVIKAIWFAQLLKHTPQQRFLAFLAEADPLSFNL